MRITDYAALVPAFINPERAFGHVERISRFHRVQMSEGYRQAAEYCLEALKAAGVECRLLDIPLPKGARRLGQPGFDSWDCAGACLTLRGPAENVLCDYEKDPLCVIQRSYPAAAQGVEIVLAQGGEWPEGAPLRGNILFVHDGPWEGPCKRALAEGALGVLTDYITPGYARGRREVYDGRGFFSFHWTGGAGETPGLGFVLTPRQGDRLAALCRSLAAEGRRPVCDLWLKAAMGPGHVEVVEGRIPGREAGELVVTAHLCHPKPSANDNASGCAGALELMTALSGLIQVGRLPRPRLGVTMALVPEVSGTFAYLDARKGELPRMKAVLNLDMIGRRQEGRSGMLGIMGPCDALSSFIIDLMAYVRRLTDREAPTFNIGGFVSPFHSQVLEYFGGSDQVPYGDPAIGVPGVTMMQWMDRDYHTSLDVPENIDPEMLKKSISMAAVWAYALADLKATDLPPILALNRERFLETLHRAAERKPPRGSGLGDVYAYELEVFCHGVADIRRFTGGAEALIAEQEALLRGWMEQTRKRMPAPPAEADGAPADTRVPVRDIAAPLTFVGEPLGAEAAGELAALKARFPGLYGYNSVDFFILSRVDGKRSVGEIARLVGMESRFYEPAYVSGYIDWLCRHGAAHFREG